MFVLLSCSQAVATGPVVVYFEVLQSESGLETGFQHYTGGIYRPSNLGCGEMTNHASELLYIMLWPEKGSISHKQFHTIDFTRTISHNRFHTIDFTQSTSHNRFHTMPTSCLPRY